MLQWDTEIQYPSNPPPQGYLGLSTVVVTIATKGLRGVYHSYVLFRICFFLVSATSTQLYVNLIYLQMEQIRYGKSRVLATFKKKK